MEQKHRALSEAIARAQKEAGLSDSELARQMNVAIPYVGMVKRGNAGASRGFLTKLLSVFPNDATLERTIIEYLKGNNGGSHATTAQATDAQRTPDPAPGDAA